MNIFSENAEFDPNFYSIVKKFNKKDLTTRKKAFHKLFECLPDLPIATNTYILKSIARKNMQNELKKESTQLLLKLLDYDPCTELVSYWFVNYLENEKDEDNVRVMAKINMNLYKNIMEHVPEDNHYMILKAYFVLLTRKCEETVKNFTVNHQLKKDIVSGGYLISSSFQNIIAKLDCNTENIFKMVVYILAKMNIVFPQEILSVTNPSVVNIKYKIIRKKNITINISQFYADSLFLCLENIRYMEEKYKNLDYTKIRTVYENVLRHLMDKPSLTSSDCRKDIILAYILHSTEICDIFSYYNDFEQINQNCESEKINMFLKCAAKQQCFRKNDDRSLQQVETSCSSPVMASTVRDDVGSVHSKDHIVTMYFDKNSNCFVFGKEHDKVVCIEFYEHPMVHTLTHLANLHQIIARCSLLSIKIRNISNIDSSVLSVIKECIKTCLDIIDKVFFVTNKEHFCGNVLYRRYPDLITSVYDIDGDLVHLLNEEQQREYGILIIRGEKAVIEQNIPDSLLLPCLYRKYLENGVIDGVDSTVNVDELFAEYLDHRFVVCFQITYDDILNAISEYEVRSSIFYSKDIFPVNAFFFKKYHLKPFSNIVYRDLREILQICKYKGFGQPLLVVKMMLNRSKRVCVQMSDNDLAILRANTVFCKSTDISMCISICQFFYSKKNEEQLCFYRQLNDGMCARDHHVLYEHFYENQKKVNLNSNDIDVLFNTKCQKITKNYLLSLSLDYLKMCYIRTVNFVMKFEDYKFCILEKKTKNIYLVNNYVMKPHYVMNENLVNLKIDMKFIQYDKLRKIKCYRREMFYNLEYVIDRLSSHIFNTYVKTKNTPDYKTMTDAICYFDSSVWYYVFTKSVSRIRNISAVLFVEKTLHEIQKKAGKTTNDKAVHDRSVKINGCNEIDIRKFIRDRKHPLYKSIKEEFAFNFPTLFSMHSKDEVHLDALIKKEVKNKLYNVKTKLLKRSNGYELEATYFNGNEDFQCRIIIPHNKRPEIFTARKDIFILKLNKLLESTNRYIEVLSLWKINLDNKLLGKKECLICYYIVDSRGKLPDTECKICLNAFHEKCVDKYHLHSKNRLCPFCRNRMD